MVQMVNNLQDVFRPSANMKERGGGGLIMLSLHDKGAGIF